LRRFPAPVVLGGLAVLYLAATQRFTLESPLWTRGLTYALFFGVGVYGGRAMRVVARMPVAAAAASGVAYLLYQGIGMSALMSLQIPSPWLAARIAALYVAAALAAVGAAGILARVRPYRAAGEFLGRRTLGVYVLHIPLIVALDLASRGVLAPAYDRLATMPRLDAVYPFLATALVVGSALVVETVLRRCGLGFLFELPQPVQDRVETFRATLGAIGDDAAAGPRSAGASPRTDGTGTAEPAPVAGTGS